MGVNGTTRTERAAATDSTGQAVGLSEAEDESAAVLRAVGRVIKSCRERAGLTQTELGSAIGYGYEQVSSVERGRRAPQPEFLEAADRALDTGGMLAALKKDVAEARYPKKVRDLAKLEAEAVELGAYANAVVHGLFQTEEYARALYCNRRPAYTEDEIERYVAARMSRQDIFDRRPLPTLTFVQDEVTLRRPIGGAMVMRRQLERLLEIGQLRNVDIQVMPTDREEHAGLGGAFQVLRMGDGGTVVRVEAQAYSQSITVPKSARVLESQYGIIRSQALTPRESQSFIEKVLGET
ncbi:XRE family transcriptional regulator [Streptomyces armeniacus]|uniref:XRE family transcriptional regulator n=1 Tax=Streptomyces armeniacus TaxID=83291 RepID=A0A345XU13_9ACTN|nr:helix-turn-helix transcriptional regulator [Streptomyces armeniacus]AXK35129.1 XRE family transcriptional regulator [Streptomyces armeniacus]